ncbi:hypothetical protein NM688_g498 [Phlebia brevispora]|uniref:Uncharacterized protein n=1 Tax=Phlebia brevispora TaxID=194682 RepID=A0ACC1TE68_9APHY|nr:hypothetical protein NM688_g498 [Phlebia brevispora]
MDEPAKTIEQLDEEIKLRLKELNDLRLTRNASLPISRLPAEILARIFDEYQFLEWTASCHSGGHSWWRPAHVCHYWREVAVGNPGFWRRIFLGNGDFTNRFQEMLQRSKNLPLVMYCDDSKSRILRNKEELSPILSQVSPRSESLTFCAASSDSLMQVINSLEPNGDSLYILSLIGDYKTEATFRMPEIKLKNLPNLSMLDLTFPGLTLDHAKAFFTERLRDLELSLCSVPESGELQAVLSGMPRLEALRLTCPREDIPESIFVERPISMPRARSVRFIGNPDTCAYFLNTFSLSNHCSLHTECHSTNRYEASGNMNLTHLGTALSAKLWVGHTDDPRPLVNVMFHREGKAYTLSAWREPDPLKLSARNYHCRNLIVKMFATRRSLPTLFTCFDILPKARLFIVGGMQEMEDLRFSPLANVESLCIKKDDRSSAVWAVHTLKERISQLPPTLMLPSLRTLYLPEVCFNTGLKTTRAKLSLDNLKEALETRKKENLPLRSLVLTSPTGLTREALNKLRGMVEDVVWDGETINMAVSPPIEATGPEQQQQTVRGGTEEHTHIEEGPRAVADEDAVMGEISDIELGDLGSDSSEDGDDDDDEDDNED